MSSFVGDGIPERRLQAVTPDFCLRYQHVSQAGFHTYIVGVLGTYYVAKIVLEMRKQWVVESCFRWCNSVPTSRYKEAIWEKSSTTR